MKYLYHRPDDGGILLIAHHLEPHNPNPYIEIDDSIAEDFFSARLHFFNFAVTAEGTLKNLNPSQNEIDTVSAADKIYAIPRSVDIDADFVLVQDKEKKLLTITLTKNAIVFGQNNRFMNQSHCLLVACVPADPALIHWYRAIPIVELAQGTASVAYDSEDNIQFYTNKIFRTYKHEQLN